MRDMMYFQYVSHGFKAPPRICWLFWGREVFGAVCCRPGASGWAERSVGESQFEESMIRCFPVQRCVSTKPERITPKWWWWFSKGKCPSKCPMHKKIRFRNDTSICPDDVLPKTTLPETNIAPKNGWLEYYFPIGETYFQVLLLLVSGRVTLGTPKTWRFASAKLGDV